MNHSALIGSPRFSAMPPTAAAPSSTTPAQISRERKFVLISLCVVRGNKNLCDNATPKNEVCLPLHFNRASRRHNRSGQNVFGKTQAVARSGHGRRGSGDTHPAALGSAADQSGRRAHRQQRRQTVAPGGGGTVRRGLRLSWKTSPKCGGGSRIPPTRHAAARRCGGRVRVAPRTRHGQRAVL